MTHEEQADHENIVHRYELLQKEHAERIKQHELDVQDATGRAVLASKFVQDLEREVERLRIENKRLSDENADYRAKRDAVAEAMVTP